MTGIKLKTGSQRVHNAWYTAVTKVFAARVGTLLCVCWCPLHAVAQLDLIKAGFVFVWVKSHMCLSPTSPLMSSTPTLRCHSKVEDKPLLKQTTFKGQSLIVALLPPSLLLHLKNEIFCTIQGKHCPFTSNVLMLPLMKFVKPAHFSSEI